MVRVIDKQHFRYDTRRAAARATLIAVTSAAVLLAGAAEALAVDSIAVRASEGAQAGVPMTITASGSSSEASTLRVFVHQGDGCANTAGGAAANADRQAARSGSTEVITKTPNGPYSYAASYTPPAPGSYAICAYLFRTSTTGSTSSQVSSGFGVAAAPAGAAGTAPGSGDSASGVAKTANCIVPKLKGRMYETARKRLHAAGCIIGKTIRPSKKKAAPLHPGGRRRILKVLSTSPKAGTVLKARGRVTVRLVYVTPKTSSSSN
jgi:hypothetical protein